MHLRMFSSIPGYLPIVTVKSVSINSQMSFGRQKLHPHLLNPALRTTMFAIKDGFFRAHLCSDVGRGAKFQAPLP